MRKKWLFFLCFASVSEVGACSHKHLILTLARRCNEGRDRAEEEGGIRAKSGR
jgi:hypothetical protein